MLNCLVSFENFFEKQLSKKNVIWDLVFSTRIVVKNGPGRVSSHILYPTIRSNKSFKWLRRC